MSNNLLTESSEVTDVRAFNRFYTNVIGLLHSGLLDSPYSLTEARVIFELAQRDVAELADLRRTLDIDAAYFSRILARFEADGLVTRDRSPLDGRRQVVTLTESGRRAFSELDARSAESIGQLLAPLGTDGRRQLLGAMSTVRRLLEDRLQPAAIVLRPPAPGDYGWVVERHGVLYADEYGWDETFEALVARIVSDYVQQRDPRRESAWIAELDGQRAGCVLCVKKDHATAQLRLLLVEPQARGFGIGSRLVQECLRFARGAKYERIVLWTNDVLVAARRIYERAGFRLERSEPHHSFGHDLVGQYWRLDL